MSLSIRRAVAADEDVLTAFNAGLAWETEHLTLHEPTLRAGVRAALADAGKGFYTVAERNGAVIGQVLVTWEWSDWRNGWFWWLQSVFVRPDARQGGVFRALFEHLRQQAEAEPSVIGLRLYMEQDNARARETYRSLGLVETAYRLLEIYPLTEDRSPLGRG